MKRFFRLLSIAVLLAACPLFALHPTNKHLQHKNKHDKNILIVCYSQTGNTRHVAHQIKKAVGGTIHNLVPAKPYPKDLKACVAQVKKEKAKGERPELKNIPDCSKYDIIFIGSPNWCGTIAPPVETFIANGKLQGKKVILFVTHGKGGLQNCEKDFKAALQGASHGTTGAFPGKNVKRLNSNIQQWARSAMLD